MEPNDDTAATAIRPSVVAVMLYLGLFSIWAIWVFATARYPTGEEPGPFRLLPSRQYVALSAVNAALALVVVLGALRSLRGGAGLRRAHVAGALLALLGLLLVQLGAHWAHGPLPARGGGEATQGAEPADSGR